MPAGPLRDALTLVLGVLTGVMSAAFGVGGAVISTPGVRLLGASALTAVGTTLPSILPSALTGTIQYSRQHLVNWRVVRAVAPAGIVMAVIGSKLSHSVPGNGHWLMILTAALLAFTAYRMAKSAPETLGPTPLALPPDVSRTGQSIRRRNRSPVVAAAVGALAGLMSGLLGVGGGVVMVPGFTEFLGMELKPTIATSLAAVGIFAIPSTITHALQKGDIDWRFALLLAVGVVPGARLGARAAIRANDRGLRRVVALFLGVVSVIYAAGEVAALIR
ncbi:MAG: putative permease [Acidimicrobiales bacterium]|nr:putative permease [Acidimicrobiales bacterium]